MTSPERLDECYRAGTAVTTILGRVADLVAQLDTGGTRTCGSCGCLCRADEPCPACRFALAGPL